MQFDPSIPWTPITDDKVGQCQLAELRLELSENHKLFGLNLTPVAIGYYGDDVLFRLDDGQFAAVHLTWSSKPEPYPDCPSAAIYPSFAEFVEAEKESQKSE